MVGGGIVGVETAAEIVEQFPSKQVTLVHSGPYLMDRTAEVTPSVAKYCHDFLVRKGCTVLLGTRVEARKSEGENPRFYAKDGTPYDADIVLLCTGIVATKKKFIPNLCTLIFPPRERFPTASSWTVPCSRRAETRGDL